jgi:FkbM family methyltransferase
MHSKRAKRLLSRRRWQRSHQLFHSPVRAFLATSFVSRRPFVLHLRSGGSLTVSRGGRDHHLWDWLLSSESEIPVRLSEDGCIVVEVANLVLHLRPGTLDAQVLREVLEGDAYGLKSLPGRLGTVLDLGSNAGFFSCAVLPRADRVISVEAVAENYRHGLDNILRNGGCGEDVLRLAVASDTGKSMLIYLDPRNSGGHSLYPGLREGCDSNHELVETITLADLLARTGCQQVDLLKCDIEGAEYAVFLHTPLEVLRRIDRITMEAHVSHLQPPKLLRQLMDYFAAAGFHVELNRPLPDPPIVKEHFLLLRAWRTGAGSGWANGSFGPRSVIWQGSHALAG